jgi:2-succinyl-5-enolpyruvyl-6-hydroxy-3-cyclohexene-1-carboxylate synthase
VGTGDDNARFSSELIAGLADAGVGLVLVSPGSRNTPLTLAAVAEPRVRDLSIRDERSAGFIALGFAKATGRPAAVICTSGSAAAHYLPAVVEANQSGTPLVVLTADRPRGLRGTGAPQTMDQVMLYGSHAKYFLDSSHDGRTSGANATMAALEDPPGAAHLNVAFDEPLVPTEPVPSPPASTIGVERLVWEPTGIIGSLAGKRVAIVASGRMRPGFGPAVAELARRLDAPILADPQASVTGPNVIGTSDLLVAAHDEDGRRLVTESLAPDVFVRLGPLPTSKPLWRWMETSAIPQIHIESSRLTDPLGSASTTIVLDPTDVLMSEPVPEAQTGYADEWRAFDRIASAAREAALDDLAFPNEPEVARSTADHAPHGAILWLASSRPIRDVDAFARRRDDRIVLANRGVNGIDGTISSAIGAALSGTPVVLLIGDVAALHDATALAEAAALEVPLRIVVVNNDGGGIFELLPQASSPVIDRSDFERHWGTPHGLSLSAISRSFGLQAWRVDDRQALRDAVGAPIAGPELIEVITDRGRLVADHTHVRRSVADALRRSHEVE